MTWHLDYLFPSNWLLKGFALHWKFLFYHSSCLLLDVCIFKVVFIFWVIFKVLKIDSCNCGREGRGFRLFYFKCLPFKVVSIKGCLPLKVVFNRRVYFIEVRLP